MDCLAPRTILAVDRNPRNLELLMQVLGSRGYPTLAVPDLVQLDALLARSCPIGLALVDVEGFGTAIWERCQRLHERHVDLLVLVPRRAFPFVQLQSARCGARAVLPKPLSPRVLAEMVSSVAEASP
jgi:CheY-like chemotaxis protein